MDPELVRLWNPNLEVWDHQMIVISKQLNIFSGSSLGRSPSGPWKAPAKPLQNNGANARVCLFLFFQTDSLLPKMSAGVFFLETDSLLPKILARVFVGDKPTVAENFRQSCIFFGRRTHCCQKFRRELYFLRQRHCCRKFWPEFFFEDRLTDAENFGQNCFSFFFFSETDSLLPISRGPGSQETAK